MSTPLRLTDSASPRTSAGSTSSSSGSLRITILSAYDLPVREPPLCVRVKVGCAPSVETGPPSQRHKDRNSFKFSTTSTVTSGGGGSGNPNHPNELEIKAPLSKLYQDSVTIELVYDHNQQQQSNKLMATYPLNQLRIGETTWLILHLDGTTTLGDGDDPVSANSSADSVQVGPTLRLHMTLNGPYRTEIAALVNVAQSWFGLVDGIERSTQGAISNVPKVLPLDPKLLLIPAVPLATIAIVSAPVVLGILTVGLPFFLPLVTLLLLFGLMGASGVMALYFSTAAGRSQLAGVTHPLASTLLSTPSGQRLVYQTGPRPSPIQLVKVVVPHGMWNKLVLSLVIDFIGSASYLIPLAGEATDVAWAPIQTILIMAMYNDTSSSLKYVSFVEEILPFTDIIPTATMGWIMEFGIPLILNAANANKKYGGRLHQEAGEPSSTSSNLPPQLVAVSNPSSANSSPIK